MQKPTVTYGEEKPFYYVIAKGGEAPTKEHRSRVSARNEATRLAQKNPGVQFSVVKLKDSVIYHPAGTASHPEADYEKQVFARGALRVGGHVLVKDKHHAHAGRVGVLDHFGNLADNDTSVYVLLSGDTELTRFSPSSLERCEPIDEPAAEEASEANPVGKLVAGLLGRVLAEAVIKNISAKAEAAAERHVSDQEIGDIDHPLMQEAIKRLKGIAPGTRIVITIDSFMSQLGLEPPEFAPGVLLSHPGDPRVAIVKLDDEDATREANASRIYAADDPAVLAVYAGSRR